MATFTYSPSYAANVTITPRVRTAMFGDGYQQRVADGINTKPRMWNLSFTQKDADIDNVESFLDTAGGVTSFDWTPPHGSIGKWKCKEWSRSKVTYGVDTLTATFEEVFGE